MSRTAPTPMYIRAPFLLTAGTRPRDAKNALGAGGRFSATSRGHGEAREEVTMRLLEWIRGRPRDTQEDRLDARSGDGATVEPDNIADATTPAEVETATQVGRDEEAVRHQGI